MDTLKELDSELPLVSIGLPTYNRPTQLKQTIECLVNQEYSNIEIIISNNNSTKPEVEKILTDIEKRYPNLIVFHQKRNIGPIENYKFVLSKAKGKYFMWAADDDYFAPKYILSCVNFLELHSEFILCTTNTIQKIDNKEVKKIKYSATTEGLNQLQRLEYIISHTRKSCFAIYGVIRTGILKKCQLSGFLGGDGLLVVQLASFGTFKQLDLDYYTYNYHTNTEAKNLSANKEYWLRLNNYLLPKLIVKYEAIFTFLIFSYNIIKWKNIDLQFKLKSISFIYKTVHTSRKFSSKVYNFLFFLRTKRLIIVNKKSLKSNVNKKDIVAFNWLLNNQYFDCDQLLNDLNNFSNTIFKNYSHVVLSDSDLSTNDEIEIKRIINKVKYYNSHTSLKLNKENLSIIPLRKYIKFNNLLESNIKKSSLVI